MHNTFHSLINGLTLFLCMLNDSFCSKYHSHSTCIETSHSIDLLFFFSSLICPCNELFLYWNTKNIVHCMDKSTSLSLLIHYSEPVEWLFLTRHRETLYVQMHTFREGPSKQYMFRHVLITLSVGGVQMRSEHSRVSLYARVCP